MNLKIALKICVLIAANIRCYSQYSSEPFANDLLPKFSWGITVTPALMAKANIHGNTSKYQLKSAPQFGAEILIDYHYYFEKNYSLCFSAGGGEVAYNFDYYISKNLFTPPPASTLDVYTNSDASRESGYFYFKAQVELERLFPYRKSKRWVIATGVSLLTTIHTTDEFDDILTYPNGETKTFLVKQQDDANHGKPWFNFHISAGHQWFVKRSIFQASLKVNYSPTDFVSGTYQFDVGNQPQLIGKYGVPGSYIGLCISYIFHGAKKD